MSLTEQCKNNRYNYSFKIFPRFWLGKTTRIIHHNQRLNCHIKPMTSKWRHRFNNFSYWTVDRGNLGTGLSCFGCLNKMEELSGGHCTRLTAKYCLKTYSKNSERSTRRTTFAIWSILQTGGDLYLLNFPKKMHYRCELNIDRGRHF